MLAFNPRSSKTALSAHGSSVFLEVHRGTTQALHHQMAKGRCPSEQHPPSFRQCHTIGLIVRSRSDSFFFGSVILRLVVFHDTIGVRKRETSGIETSAPFVGMLPKRTVPTSVWCSGRDTAFRDMEIIVHLLCTMNGWVS